MTEHRFGGDWTREKLEILRAYLIQYRLIFARNLQARHFRTVYVDAFAGTGDRVDARESPMVDLLGEPEDMERESYKKGSARIALELASPFDGYVFVEKSPDRAATLRTMIDRDFPALSGRCRVVTDDGNRFLQLWLKETDWSRTRAVVFLDPYGMAVEWKTIEAIARTRAIDLWVLFPVGTGVNRLLTRGRTPPPEWAARLTAMLGTDAWSTFYAPSPQADLFSAEAGVVKDADFDRIGKFFLQQLAGVFAKVADHAAHLENSRRNPLYWLCFAAGNPKGASTAVRIADHLLRPKRGRQ